MSSTTRNNDNKREHITPPVALLEVRIDALRRDVKRLYNWILALVGANLSLVATIITQIIFS